MQDNNSETKEDGAMRRRTKTTLFAVGGALALSAIAAVPVMAADGPPATGTASPAPVARAGMGPHADMAGNGDRIQLRDGTCAISPTGTVTEAQRAALATNTAQEKLAQDLYQAFAARYAAPVFDRIAAAEGQHLQAMRTLLNRYGIADPTANTAAGKFTDPTLQATYDRLLAQGDASQQAALRAGQSRETTEIEFLRTALNGLTAPDLQRVYTHLLDASQQHLDAFTTWLNR